MNMLLGGRPPAARRQPRHRGRPQLCRLHQRPRVRLLASDWLLHRSTLTADWLQRAQLHLPRRRQLHAAREPHHRHPGHPQQPAGGLHRGVRRLLLLHHGHLEPALRQLQRPDTGQGELSPSYNTR